MRVEVYLSIDVPQTPTRYVPAPILSPGSRVEVVEWPIKALRSQLTSSLVKNGFGPRWAEVRIPERLCVWRRLCTTYCTVVAVRLLLASVGVEVNHCICMIETPMRMISHNVLGIRIVEGPLQAVRGLYASCFVRNGLEICWAIVRVQWSQSIISGLLFRHCLVEVCHKLHTHVRLAAAVVVTSLPREVHKLTLRAYELLLNPLHGTSDTRVAPCVSCKPREWPLSRGIAENVFPAGATASLGMTRIIPIRFHRQVAVIAIVKQMI
mmetsp:Transcript_714/g.1526  ORF Transcript_714/g.1526 Transcript_714/m.1526 type:complete len:266 (-) Transcript_714:978-1775(-)